MLEINEKKNFNSKKDIIKINNNNEINYLFSYIENFPQLKQVINDKSEFNKESLLFHLKNTNKIILIYLNEKYNPKNFKKINSKRTTRYINYLISLLENNSPNNIKKQNDDKFSKVISKIFILHIFNLLKNVLMAKKNSNNKNIIICQLNYLLNNILNIIGIYYTGKIISEDFFEEFLKFLLFLSLAKKIENKPMEKDEISNMMFFKSCINVLKKVFNKLFILQNEYTQRQEELLNNIIIYINKNILGYCDKSNDQKYSNKIFLSNNDYKTTLLIDLTYIISKTKKNYIKDSFINLLSDIYHFSFNYDNCMKPTLQLLEPLFININKKEISQIEHELKIADFGLSFFNSLIDKENKIKKQKSCILKQGFYFYSENSGIICEFNSLENEFIIMLGFQVESNELDSILLFDILNTKTFNSLIKFYLMKTYDNNSYEMFGENSKNEMSTKINIFVGKTYIFAFHFKIKGIMQSSTIKINYVRDDRNSDKKEKKPNVLSGVELKIKNIKNENLTMFIGCEMPRAGPKKGKIENKFKGFIGDIIILNSKNIKDKIELEFIKYLLYLGGDYSTILSLFTENLNKFLYTDKISNTDPNYIELKEQINKFDENEHKLFKSIKMIISPKFFNSIEYQDDIDYMNLKNNYDYYHQKKSITFKIKKNYLDTILKTDALEDKKAIILYSSLFDKNFHIFENKSSIIEFIKYDGMHYLNLLLEYYYQIISYLCENKKKFKNEDINNISKEINQNILSILNFCNMNIIQKKYHLNYLEETNQFFYQMSVTLLKFMEIDILNIQIIKYLADMMSTFDRFISEFISKDYEQKNLIYIRDNLYDFLSNPKLFNVKDESYLEKINFVFLNLLIIIKFNSDKDKIKYMGGIFNVEILNKLLFYIWLLDNNSNINNTIINKIKNNNNNSYEIIIEKTKENYMLLLIEFLKSSNPKDKYPNIKSNSEKQLSIINDNSNEKDTRSSKILMIKEDDIKLDDNKKEKNLINYFFDKIIEQRRNKNIFFNMSIILTKTDLINELEESEIEKIELLLMKELNEKYDKNNETKKIIYLSCLLILIEYYFSDCKADKSKLNKKKKSDFHKFIRSLNLTLDFFCSLMSSLKYVKYIRVDIEFEIIENKKSLNKNSLNLGNEIKEFGKGYIESNSGLSFMDIDINKINEYHSNIVISILEDIIYLLYKLGMKNISIPIKKDKDSKSSKNNESFNSSLSQEQNVVKDIYEILKKNIDIIFRYPESELYRKIFSFEKEICAELFYLKWKMDGEEAQNYIEKVIMKYHKDLLKNHCSSFIFKFLFFIANENVLPFESCFEEDKNKYKNKIIKLRINLMIYIIDILFNYQKEIKRKSEMINQMINLLNFLILINEELDYNKNILFKNNKFCEALYKYISLLEKTGLLYSNYYIELGNNCGRTISETVYDLFFSAYDNDFREDIFNKIFTKIDIKEKEIFTIFYLMDLCKEKILEKEKKVKDKLYSLIPGLSNLNLFKLYFFNQRKKKYKLFLNKNIFSIDDINFCMYFLAKTFIYFDSNLMKSGKNEFRIFLTKKFLPLLSKNIFRLYTKRNNFYGNKRCPKFPLYNHTKKYFESYLIQNPNDFKKYESFFKTDMKINLKEEYSIFYCYSSRLLHDIKRVKKPPRLSLANSQDEIFLEKTQSFCVSSIKKLNKALEMNNDMNGSSNSLPLISTKSTYTSNLKDLHVSNKSLTLKSLEDLDNSKSSDDFKLIEENENDDIEYHSGFEIISKNNIIHNPKNLFFKRIFSGIFKNIMFNDKCFQKVKRAYLIKYKNNKICKESKQMNYPTKQKNYSNFLEPMMFLRRDYNYYNKIFFPVSHNYINNKIIESNYETIYFYPHKYRHTTEKENKKLYCELVTRQYIFFGKMFFFDNYILFESCEDPRDTINNNDSYNEYEVFLKYSISTKNKDNSTNKNKKILIFSLDIKEIIKRRTLLVSNSIEIFSKNGKSYFFNFFRVKEVEKAYQYINEINENLSKSNYPKFNFKLNNYEDNIKNILFSFRIGKLSNYEYLLYLNKYSTRTYNDLSQYPVFPWLALEHDKIEKILSTNESNFKNCSFLRNLNYPISMQNEIKRKNAFDKFIKENQSKFTCHSYKHYSTSAFIYYYLMRMNPYEENMIAFQNFALENSDRVFNSFNDLELILNEDSDNRELIPDFFCYFDYFCNLNCSYLGQREDGEMNDDFELKSKNQSKYINNISSYVYLVYREKKLLNHTFISKNIYKWVDIIFGKNQLPHKEEDAAKSCNIYSKSSYEQKYNFEEKYHKYQKLINLNQFNKEIFIEKMRNKLDMTLNFGQTPKQIMKESNIYEGENKISIDNYYKALKSEEKLIFFKKMKNDTFLIVKNEKKKSKNKARIVIIYNNKNFKAKDNNIYNCKSLNFYIKNKNYIILDGGKEIKIPLYHPDYAISYIYFYDIANKIYVPIILTCRYYGNYFSLQSNEKSLNVFCEDFVTSIKSMNSSKEGDNHFFTGLSNGKLIEWKIISYLNILEIKHVYAHKSSITAIEIYNSQKIIITAGEDNFIYIRKLYDFELLTAIDLKYSFGNQIISQSKNTFPSLIQISELNILYILLYDLNSKKSIIRGYNLNGLFFAQTNDKYFMEKNYNLIINHISFTKCSNLVIGFYNSNKYAILQAWGLEPICPLKNITTEINQNDYPKLIKYDYSLGIFHILFNNLFIAMSPKDLREQIIIDSL